MSERWPCRPLGEVCCVDKTQDLHQGLPYVGLEHIESGTGRLLAERAAVNVKSRTFLFDDNHVLYGRLRPYLNKVIVPDFVGHCSTEILPLRPNEQVLDRQFLAYWLMSDKTVEALTATSTGARMPRVNVGLMMTLDIPVPSLVEQARIVRVLDGAIDRMHAATRGFRTALERTDELLSGALEHQMASDDSPWPSMTLHEMLEEGIVQDHMDGNHGSDYPRKHEFIDQGVAYLSAKCLTPQGGIDFRRAKYLSPERVIRLRKGFAKDGDVLFAHNATVGPVSILRTSAETVVLGTSLTYYRCNLGRLLPSFLAHYMRSDRFIRQYKEVMKQSTRNQVPITMQRTFTFPLPPPDVQARIVRQMDDLHGSTASLKRTLTARTQLVAEMRSALLDRAFSGGLC